MLTTDLDKLVRLPSLPTVAIEVLKALANPEVAAFEVVNLISADPALSAKVLSAANSARYRGSRPIGDIHRASMLLGKRVVCSLALGFSLAEASMARGKHAELFKSYWLKSFAQGLAARTLAERFGGCPADESFTLGLIARIGQLVLLKHIPDEFEACLTESESTGEQLESVEARRLGLTSQDLTARLIARWNLPEHFLNAVNRQHPSHDDDQPTGVTPDLGTYLRIAASVADFIASTDRGIHLVRLNEALAQVAPPSDDDVEWIVISVSKQLRLNAELFHVDMSKVGSPAELLSEATEQLAQLAMADMLPTDGQPLSQELMQENGQLRRQLEAVTRESTIDPLTTVFNRRYFQHRLSEQAQRAKQTGSCVALLLADVDHFKRVNDSYGHPAGDSVLLAVAQTMEATVRGGDLVARFGGEEFVILIEATNLDGLRNVAERVRRAVSEIQLPTPQGTLTVTISLGGCIGMPTGNASEFETRLVAEADRCLYDAKSTGRNRVVVAPLPAADQAKGSRLTAARLSKQRVGGFI